MPYVLSFYAVFDSFEKIRFEILLSSRVLALFKFSFF